MNRLEQELELWSMRSSTSEIGQEGLYHTTINKNGKDTTTKKKWEKNRKDTIAGSPKIVFYFVGRK